jgi:hypothetical protein
MLLPALLLAITSVTQAQSPAFAPTQRRIEYQDIGTGQYGVRDGQTSACEHTALPEPLDTPNPVLREGASVLVDVVIGWDGKIYSGFVLDGNLKNYKTVEDTLRSWRFRPATCNGSPVNVEGRISFSRR